ncbi:hypothetical protein EV356DRAFT_525114 [Viridothelium virens]|uniref:Solute carrier family 40 member n=1 Tax=Viridothelium virens TaxID=1048519 RepID=A0A6A6H3W1_VIRVR|nr:hypothetical protein EV356DRAFT_525114 [Viridothelium virens]
MPCALTYRLYVSHFLSTWNSRMFEFGAVLFLAAIYPGTLTPMSIYALARSGSAVLLSPAVGRIIDTKNRLSVVRFSIVAQRLSVISSCVIFYLMASHIITGSQGMKASLAGVTLLAGLEKLCSVMNLVSVERDWVVVISGEDESARRILNARMRRIDLFCKLLGPLVISLINAGSFRIAILITLVMNTISIPIEYFTISTVFRLVPSLRRSQASRNDQEVASDLRRSLPLYFKSLISQILFYFRHPALHPSFALALLYFTVLSFSGQMLTFLLFSGYTSAIVGATRTISTIFELSATWIAPRVIKKIGAVRAGSWFLNWQMICLAAGVSLFWTLHGRIAAVSSLVASVALSRVGLWGFDLSAQMIVQEQVEDNQRGAFSTTEALFQNLFELLSYVSTLIFSRPDQFKWPVIISTTTVYMAGGLYTLYVRKQRGHLLHFNNLMKGKQWHSTEEAV